MKKISVLLAMCMLLMAGCTAQERAKSFGGSATSTLPKNQKLVNVTWKDTDLWMLTRPMKDTETPITYTFQEDSTLGWLNGTVTIVETR